MSSFYIILCIQWYYFHRNDIASLRDSLLCHLHAKITRRRELPVLYHLDGFHIVYHFPYEGLKIHDRFTAAHVFLSPVIFEMFHCAVYINCAFLRKSFPMWKGYLTRKKNPYLQYQFHILSIKSISIYEIEIKVGMCFSQDSFTTWIIFFPKHIFTFKVGY